MVNKDKTEIIMFCKKKTKKPRRDMDGIDIELHKCIRNCVPFFNKNSK